MPREVDERKKRAALRKLRRAADLAAQGIGPPLTDWEVTFLRDVEARLETFGSAFADPMKGAEGEALSGLQQLKLKQIDKKARGNPPRGLKAKQPMVEPRALPTAPAEAAETEASAPPRPKTRPALVPAAGLAGARNVTVLRKAKPRLTVIQGGARKSEN
jgi:hypothetical protein